MSSTTEGVGIASGTIYGHTDCVSVIEWEVWCRRYSERVL